MEIRAAALGDALPPGVVSVPLVARAGSGAEAGREASLKLTRPACGSAARAGAFSWVA